MGETNLTLPFGSGTGQGGVTHSWWTSAMCRRTVVAACLVVGDAAAAVLSVELTRALIGHPYVMGTAAVPLLIGIYFCCGLYTGFGPSPFERFKFRIQGLTLFVLLNCFVGVISGASIALASAGFCAILLLVFGHYAETFVRQILIDRRLWGAPTAIVGDNTATRQLCRQLQHHPELALRPVGFLRISSGGAEHTASGHTAPLPVLGTISSIDEALLEAEVLIFSSPAALDAIAPDIGRRFSMKRLIVAGGPQSLQSLWIRTRTLGETFGIELRHDRYLRRNRHLKRTIDLLFAIPACILTAPLIGILALAIKLVDPGPAFYFQDRVGMNGRVIRICKLRTMYGDAEDRLQDHLARNPEAKAEWSQFFKLANDPRILPVIGRLIRRMSLDELPQVWNVLSGAMSLVGPRPFPGYHVSSFDKEFQPVRASVPPGLTGLWQVASRSNGDLEVQRSQDLFYIQNWSVWLDFYVMVETVPAVLLGRGAR